ncbi:MAG: glycosyltransferase family 9 protein [Methylacidiphilales bacterium]|nr:glycosyltransferase family 9 protein [Candidatus Methylacidiphilales bacterium]
MNFPGLDFFWSNAHHAGHALGLGRTWSLVECREALLRNDKILVVATTALGDSLLTLPLVETISERLGRDRVSLLVRAPYTGLYEADPRLHRLFSVRGKYRWAGLEEKLRGEPHRIAFLANITEPDLIPFLWRCGVRGFLRYRTRWTRYPRWMANPAMLRRPGMPDYATGHAIENNLAMGKALAIEPTTHRLSLPHLRAAGPHDNTVLLHPGASKPYKRWRIENWARLADALVAKFNCAVALTGDRNEVSLCVQIAAAMQAKPLILAGKQSLPELAQAQARALIFLSGDTGPYHLAIAVGCPTVTLFAPTDRGSSIEACGPHQAPAPFHRAIQTDRMGDSIDFISVERVLAEAIAVVEAAQV